MGVVVNGEFIGPRYRAIDARIADEEAAYDAARMALTTGDAERRDALLARLDSDLAQRLTKLQDNPSACDAAAVGQPKDCHASRPAKHWA